MRVKYRPDKVTRKAIQQAITRVDVRLAFLHWLHRWTARLTGGRPDTGSVPPGVRRG